MGKTTKEPPKTAEQSNVKAIMEALAVPFELTEVHFKPAVVSGNRAMALAYVDARVIQDRLDDVLGVEGWQDSYKCLPDGSVVCRLRLRLGNEWITKVDVGGPSEQPDGGDRLKAAFSDSLKRAAVKFGVGRYLYRLPRQWVDYDPQKKQFVQTPRLPAWALPPTTLATSTPAPAALPAAPSTSTEPIAKESRDPKGTAKNSLPSNGLDLQRRLYDYDKKLADQGLCQEGELVKHVVAAGTRRGYEPDLTTWNGTAIPFAVEETRAFEAQLRLKQNRRKDVA